MKAVKGEFEHDNNMVWFRYNRRPVYGKSGRRVGYKVRADVHFTVLQADGDLEALQAKMQSLEEAYADPTAKWEFLDNDGNPTVHSIDPEETTNGIRLVSLAWEKGRGNGFGTELVTRRTGRAVIEAEIVDSESDLFSYTESIKVLSTGGSDFVIQESINSPAIMTFVKAQTRLVVVQFGNAIGYTGPPDFPEPLFSEYLKPRPIDLTESTAMQPGIQQDTLFPISWHYRFEAPPGDIEISSPQLPEFE